MITDLGSADLIVDEVYGGSRKGHAADEVLPKLVGVSAGAGFRYLGKSPEVDTLKLLALKSSFKEPDWPDHLDTETGIFTYYGDNRGPGDLHSTPRLGNAILRNLFEAAHNRSISQHFPPILLFGSAGTYRDLRFLGLAVPGAKELGQDDDLVAIWRTSRQENVRFQNYRAKFTVLDVPIISRDWIKDIQQGNAASSSHAPKAWIDWLKKRTYKPLAAPHSIEIRTKFQQLPQSTEEAKIVATIKGRYAKDSYGFERCALEISKLMMPSIVEGDLTRPHQDGGRDAIGKYQIGGGRSAISVEFALEAKCFQKGGVGVKELSRLISRLRHRQFGILVTTTYLAEQAYRELIEDGHPVVVVAAADIGRVLLEKVGSCDQVDSWLSTL